MLLILENVSDRLSIVTENRVPEAYAWIVQLSSDTDAGEAGVFRDLEELRDEAQRLLHIAIKSYQ